ncbi:probable ubiquitin-like-specific protease 2B isoform X2 [Tanacetum coccineum]
MHMVTTRDYCCKDSVNGDNESSFPKYFPCFDQPFEEVVYPKGEIDVVSIGKRDVDMLLPDTFVNDTIIDFYIKYLVDPDKEPLDACKRKEAFQLVRKWTRKVNLFEKDYIFITVNYNYNWSLIVMCHLGKVATYQDEDVTKLCKVPCVVHMDPIRGIYVDGLMQKLTNLARLTKWIASIDDWYRLSDVRPRHRIEITPKASIWLESLSDYTHY